MLMALGMQQIIGMMASSAEKAKGKEGKEAKKLAEKMSPEDIAKLTGVNRIMYYLNAKDWSSMTGAIMSMWTEYFGTPEEKAKLAAKKKEAKQGQAKKKTKTQLAGLHGQVDANRPATSKLATAVAPSTAKEHKEVFSGSDRVLIGDSMMHGMQGKYPRGSRPSFIGQDGFASGQTLARLEKEKHRLKGKKAALIYTGGNNVMGQSPEKIVGHMIKMAEICSEAKIPEIVVCSRLPVDPRRAQGEKGKKLMKRGQALRAELMKAYKAGRFPSGV